MAKKKSKKKNKDEEPKQALSAFQVKERRQRTCFVGNVPLDASAQQLKTAFSVVGKVEKVWFRSVPTQLDSKLPQRAKVILKEYSAQKDNKNAYVLFEKKEDALQAVKQLNQTQIPGFSHHIRVDLDTKGVLPEEVPEGETPAELPKQKNDTDTTIFIGNLPFSVNEEELRKHFTNIQKTPSQSDTSHLPRAGDGILNVRIVRDRETHLGKGIAYVMFSSKPLMRLAIEQKNGQMFMGRELRIKKAVSAQRLEKKRLGTEEKVRQKLAMRKMQKEAEKADDEKDGEERKDASQIGISQKSKGIKKEDDADDFRKSFKKIVSNSAKAPSIEKNGLDMTPKLAFAKKKQMKVMKEKIETGGFSRYEDLRSHETTKQAPTFKQQLRAKIEKKKKINLKNINTIKVKRIVDK